MFRTIVVGCDGSERDATAITLAQALRHPEGRLLLATVVPPLGPYDYVAGDLGFDTALVKEADDLLAGAARIVAPDVPVEHEVVRDPSCAGGLDRLAEAADADLIVLGPSRRGALGHVAGLATAQRLLHGAPCAVVAAPHGWTPLTPRLRSIAVAADGSAEAYAAVAVAFDLAEATGATVRLVRAVEPVTFPVGWAWVPAMPPTTPEREEHADDILTAMAADAPAGVTVERHVAAGAAVDTVLRLAGDVDLLVTGSRHYGPVRRVLLGSASGGLVSQATVPVLVMPRPAAQLVGSTQSRTSGASSPTARV